MTYSHEYYIVRMDDGGNWIPLQGFDYNPWYGNLEEYTAYEKAEELWENKYPYALIDGVTRSELIHLTK